MDNGWVSSIFYLFCNSLGLIVLFVRVGEYIFGGYMDLKWCK